MAKPAKILFGTFFTLLIGGIVAATFFYFWFNAQISPINKAATESQIFTIKRNESLDSIGNRLVKEGLIRSTLVFKLVIAKEQLSKKIQAGTFRLNPSMDAVTLANSLTKGSLDFWVTIIEGQRREEIAESLSTSFQAADLKFNKDLFLELTQNDEGYLFPDSYLIPVSYQESSVAALLKRTFNAKVDAELKDDLSKSNKSLKEIVTMASLIEREARSETARKMVSGILWNRISIGMPLQVDASFQFAKGYSPSEKTWWPQPYAADKQINSPNNTYKQVGLPPAPICSPSLSSLKAALNPTASDYLYYLTGLDNQMHYAKTLDEHNLNIQKFL